MAENRYKTLTITPIRTAQHAIRVTFTNPPINLVGVDFLTDLHAFLTSLKAQDDNAPKIIVFSSSDEKIWLSHLDLHLVSAQYTSPPNVDSQKTLQLLSESIQLLNSIHSTIFIAEINGLAVGGGNEFAVNMDMRFAGPDARFGIPEVVGGLVHGGGLHRLIQLIGPARALEHNISGKAIDSTEASRIGWVNAAFDSAEELRKYVDDLVERVATFPRGGIEATKSGIQDSLGGKGSMQRDMQRLVELAYRKEAQVAISGFIERGDDQTRNAFELGLPDAIWEGKRA